MKWTKYMYYSIYFWPFRHEFTLHMSVSVYSNYHMKGSWEMHKFIVCMRLQISLRACVPGLHFLVRLTGWWTPLLTLTPDGTTCPPGLGLKKRPFFGFATVKSTTNKTVVTRVFRPFWHTNLRVLYCTVKRKIYSTVSTYFCNPVHHMMGVPWEFKLCHKHLGCCTPFRTPLRSY